MKVVNFNKFVTLQEAESFIKNGGYFPGTKEDLENYIKENKDKDIVAVGSLYEHKPTGYKAVYAYHAGEKDLRLSYLGRANAGGWYGNYSFLCQTKN